MPAEPPDEVQVFEDRKVGEPPTARVGRRGGELRLVAERHAQSFRPEVDQAAPQAQEPRRGFEVDQESAADGLAADRPCDLGSGGCREAGVGVKENQHLGATIDGQGGTGAKLQTAARSWRGCHGGARLSRQLHRAIAAAAVDDDQIITVMAGGGDRGLHRTLFLEHRDHDRKAHSCGRLPARGFLARQCTGMSSDTSFSHLDRRGRAAMVDVSAKEVTRRVAEASCRVLLSADTVERLDRLPKGDALTVARVAGVQAAKSTATWVPLAHPLPLDQVEVEIEPGESGVTIRSRVVVTARTGAEMEALTACAAAALALYDMVKSVERGAVVTDLLLEAKSGGRSGEYRRGR